MKKSRRNFTKIIFSSFILLCLPMKAFKNKYFKFIKRNYKNKTWILSSKDYK